jgi:hypothetical protein
MKETLLINMSDASAKRELMIQIGRLSGLYEVYIKPRKRTRTLDQNAFYWAAVVQPFTEWLRENYGENSIDKEQAHEMLKVKILGMVEKELPGTNETVTMIPHSKTLGAEEFSEYVDKCVEWLREFCGILVVPAELFYERPG